MLRSVVLALAVGALAAAGIAAYLSASNTADRAALEERLLSSKSAGIYRLVKTADPAAYERIIDQMAAASGPAAEFQASNQAMAAFRQEYAADHARFIADEDAKRHLSTLGALLGAMTPAPASCAKMIFSGGGALNGDETDLYFELLFDLAEASLKALIAAADRQAEAATATEADWAAVFDAWRAEGGTEAQIQAITAPDAASPRLCADWRAFIARISTAEGAAAQRVRASLFIALAQS